MYVEAGGQLEELVLSFHSIDLWSPTQVIVRFDSKCFNLLSHLPHRPLGKFIIIKLIVIAVWYGGFVFKKKVRLCDNTVTYQ